MRLILKKMYQEVKDIKSLEDIDILDFRNLKDTQNVIKEVLRVYPQVWNIVRKAIADDEIGGVKIEKGYQLMNSIHELHHNLKYWDDPDIFSKGLLKHKFQSLPFGGRPRFCIGTNFSMLLKRILKGLTNEGGELLCKETVMTN